MTTGNNHALGWISIEEIKLNLSIFLQRVEAGEAFIISKAGKPMAEIKPVTLQDNLLRPYGLCAGEFAVPENFDTPLPEKIIREFEGQ